MKPLSDPAVREELADAFRTLWRRRNGMRKPSKKDFLAELASLAHAHPGAEGEFNLDLKRIVVRTVTEPITLSHHEHTQKFGRFEVTIGVRPHSHEVYLRAVALDPNPSTISEDTTHPHVQDEHVCLGEGQFSFDRAANSGRYLDAVDIVFSVLRTYNDGSPYVRLSSWNGYYCNNCDDVNEDEPGTCACCDEDLCDGCCGNNCGDCGSGMHSGCAMECSTCSRVRCGGCLRGGQDGESYCSRCSARCVKCRSYFGNHDLDESNFCEDCRPEPVEEDDDDEEEQGQEEGPSRRAPTTAGGIRVCGADPTGEPCRSCLIRFRPDKLFNAACAGCYAAEGAEAVE
jgi:hypothetical protein